LAQAGYDPLLKGVVVADVYLIARELARFGIPEL